MDKKELIDRVIDWGCNCDMLNGYNCGHPEIRRLLEEALNPPSENMWIPGVGYANSLKR
jgi:hypothetical protein